MVTDICIILIFAIFVLNGYSKGFIKSVYSILSLVITLALVSVFKDTFLKMISQSQVAMEIGKLFAGSGAGHELITVCSEGITNFIAIIILYIIVKVFLKFFLTILNSIALLPIIKSVNKLLGLVIGAGIGALWIIIIINICNIIPGTSEYINSSVIAEYLKIF